jgi:HSP20 family protein
MNHTMTILKQRPRPVLFTPFGGSFSPFFSALDQLRNDEVPRSLPRVNIMESKEGFQLELLVPGFAKEELKLNVEKEILTISAEKKQDGSREGKNYRRREFVHNAFTRSFHLPEEAHVDGISARHTNGVLLVSIPKKVESRPSPKEIGIN